MLVGCSDTVNTQFPSLQEAQSAGAFERGWLPPVLPESAEDITERNDLDLNLGTGSFNYELAERPAYIQTLMQRPGSEWKKGGSEVIILRSDRSVWELTLPGGEGTGRWKMHPANHPSPN